MMADAPTRGSVGHGEGLAEPVTPRASGRRAPASSPSGQRCGCLRLVARGLESAFSVNSARRCMTHLRSHRQRLPTAYCHCPLLADCHLPCARRRARARQARRCSFPSRPDVVVHPVRIRSPSSSRSRTQTRTAHRSRAAADAATLMKYFLPRRPCLHGSTRITSLCFS